jgi:hypothetical protein
MHYATNIEAPPSWSAIHSILTMLKKIQNPKLAFEVYIMHILCTYGKQPWEASV